jgi:hypothetical protein
LAECKLLFISSSLSLLTITCETFCSFLFPLYWHHIIIPILPVGLKKFLDAPVPFMIGMQKSIYLDCGVKHELSKDVVVVDMDRNSVECSFNHLSIPLRERRKLIWRLERLSVQKPVYPYIFSNGKFAPASRSLLGQRKVYDIPQYLYSKYKNKFLQAKMKHDVELGKRSSFGVDASAESLNLAASTDVGSRGQLVETLTVNVGKLKPPSNGDSGIQKWWKTVITPKTQSKTVLFF